MKDILIITDYRGLYRQDINRNKGINLDTVIRIFKENGYNTEICNYDTIVNETGIENIKGKIIFYTSSQSAIYRSYIDDIIYELGKNNLLVPRYDMLKCHENKNYEEILRKKLNIGGLKSYVFSTYRDMVDHSDKIDYPAVVKCSTGSGSISVYKADNKEQLKRTVKKIGKGKEFIEYYLKYIYKKIKGKMNSDYPLDEKYLCKYIVQEFVPELKEDWKVLAFGEKFYVLNRKVRANDFRASGSGKFSYIKPEWKMLDYAKEIYIKLEVPFLSMDLCMDKAGNVYLIEFQGLHFGPYTIINSEEYYTYENNNWKTVKCHSDLSEEYANAVIAFLAKKTAGSENDK